MARSKVILHVESKFLRPLYGKAGDKHNSVFFFDQCTEGLVKAILTLQKDRELRGKIGNNAYQKVLKDHSVCKVVSSLTDAFTRALSFNN